MFLLTYCVQFLLNFQAAISSSTISYNNSFNVSFSKEIHPLYTWEEVHVHVNDISSYAVHLAEHQSSLKMTGFSSAKILPHKVYVSLTTVSFRVHEIKKTVYSILNGVVLPTKVYLFISRSPYLLDKGIVVIPDFLLTLVSQQLLHIVYVDNIGPHRKLLPLLAKHYYDPDVLIITVDDDWNYGDFNSTLVYALLEGYKARNGSSVIATAGRRIGLCRGDVHRYTQYVSWDSLMDTRALFADRSEMLMLPLGCGGVLYSPRFFDKVVFSNQLRNVTSFNDDLAFRLSCLVNRVPVTLTCYNCTVDVESIFMKYETMKPIERDQHHSPQQLVPYKEKSIQSDPMSRRLIRHNTLHYFNVLGGKNDIQFSNALTYLHSQGLLENISAVIEEYKGERDSSCYKSNKHVKPCALYNCEATVVAAHASGYITVNMTSPLV